MSVAIFLLTRVRMFMLYLAESFVPMLYYRQSGQASSVALVLTCPLSNSQSFFNSQLLQKMIDLSESLVASVNNGSHIRLPLGRMFVII